jgi:hypothetical protein
MIMSKRKIKRRDLRPTNPSGALPGLLSSTVTTPRPPEPPNLQTTARAGIALIPGIGGALQVIYEDVRAHMAARQWQTIQEIADNVGEDRLAARLKDHPEHQALFANGVEVATRIQIC